MKKIITKNLDDLGRIFLPLKIRKELGIKEKSTVDIFIHDNQIIISKSKPDCKICGSAENLKELQKNSYICEGCRQKVNNL